MKPRRECRCCRHPMLYAPLGDWLLRQRFKIQIVNSGSEDRPGMKGTLLDLMDRVLREVWGVGRRCEACGCALDWHLTPGGCVGCDCMLHWGRTGRRK